jgi:prepilin-type N-terminal cleavage/methylation domain-containing protein
MRRRAAFTLIELLVVIAIIALLIGILLPVLGSAKASARQVQCLSNLRQVGLGIAMYAQEHRGWFPETTHTTSVAFTRSWVWTLAPYLQDVDEIRICPEDPKGQLRLNSPTKATSYSVNEYVAVDGPDAQLNLWNLQEPTTTPTVFELANDATTSVFNDHTHSRNWFVPANGAGRWNNILDDIQPDRHLGNVDSGDHTAGGAGQLFGDSHVATVQAQQLRTWAEDNFNFAIPK